MSQVTPRRNEGRLGNRGNRSEDRPEVPGYWHDEQARHRLIREDSSYAARGWAMVGHEARIGAASVTHSSHYPGGGHAVHAPGLGGPRLFRADETAAAFALALAELHAGDDDTDTKTPPRPSFTGAQAALLARLLGG